MMRARLSLTRTIENPINEFGWKRLVIRLAALWKPLSRLPWYGAYIYAEKKKGVTRERSYKRKELQEKGVTRERSYKRKEQGISLACLDSPLPS
jgi:hypothetical protein